MPNISIDNAVKVRTLFNQVGYKHPNNKIAKDYSKALLDASLGGMNKREETVILHIGIGRALQDGIRVLKAKYVDEHGNEIWSQGRGHLIITNKNVIVLDVKNRLFGGMQAVGGQTVPISKINRFIPHEHQNKTEIELFTAKEELNLEMSFTSGAAQAYTALAVVSALSDTKQTSQHAK